MHLLARSFRGWPIRRKLIVVNLLATAVALVLVVGLFAFGAYVSARDSLIAEHAAQAKVLSNLIGQFGNPPDEARVRRALTTLKDASRVRRVTVITPAGVPIASASFGAKSDGVPPGEALTTEVSGHTLENGYLDTYEPVFTDLAHTATIVIRASLEPLREQLVLAGMLAGSIGLLLFSLALLVQERLVVAVSRPLSKLAHMMHRLSESRDLSVRAEIESSDEVGALAHGFNAMLSALQARDIQIKTHMRERKQAERRLHQLALYDPLTRLPNRASFNADLERQLEDHLAASERLAIVFIDLDDFKLVNDSLGHAVGDQLICGVGERLRQVLRASDTVYRIGGDEFTLMIAQVTDHAYVGQIAQRALDVLGQPFVINGREVFANASIGIAIAPDDASDASALVAHADTAMYQAKHQGKNSFRFYSPEMYVCAERRLAIETSLRRALDHGELQLYAQPQVALDSQEIVGAEVLLRWWHPEMGPLAPSEFIPLAEDTGLIVSIGEWSLYTAASEARGWGAHGLEHARIAVNMSGRQFRDPNLLPHLKHVLADTGLDPARMELEITEGTLMQSDQATLEMMRELRAMGVQLAIDDFGTGYSSMAYLKKYPITSIKIDQSFIRDIPYNRDDVAITRALVVMAQSLTLEVVAEGIENEDQQRFLAALGGVTGQGYLISPPVTMRSLPKVMQRWRPRQVRHLPNAARTQAPRVIQLAGD